MRSWLLAPAVAMLLFVPGCTSGSTRACTWARVDSPGTGPDFPYLTNVLALSSTDVWASAGSEGEHEASIYHWDGTAWRRATTPRLAGLYNQLFGLAASGPEDVWASGVS